MTDPTLIAHRGFAGENPENTIAAMRAAAQSREVPGRQADFIEIDVLPTADDDIVVFHDDDLAGDRGSRHGLTDATGVVWETDTGTVREAEVLESGETIPLLTEVLDAIPSTVGVNVELKNPGTSDVRVGETLTETELADRKLVWRPFVEQLLDVLDAYDTDFLLSSFCEAALATVRDASTYPIASLLYDSIEDGLAIARTYDVEAIHPPIRAIRGTPFCNVSERSGVDILTIAHEAGREVNVWTVDTWYEAEQLMAVGVDGVIVDHSTVFDHSRRRGHE